MRALGVVGWSGAGKTTLLTGLLPRLTARGLRVATVKHTHHDFDLDQPGKDSHRHRQAGAREVLLVGGARWALLHEGEPPPLGALLARLAPCDLVLVEGFRHETLPKVEVFRTALQRPPQWPDRPDIIAVATDDPIEPDGRTVLRLSDLASIADWVEAWLRAWSDAAPHTPP